MGGKRTVLSVSRHGEQKRELDDASWHGPPLWLRGRDAFWGAHTQVRPVNLRRAVACLVKLFMKTEFARAAATARAGRRRTLSRRR